MTENVPFQLTSKYVLSPEEKHAVVQILHPSLFVSDIKAKKKITIEKSGKN